MCSGACTSAAIAVCSSDDGHDGGDDDDDGAGGCQEVALTVTVNWRAAEGAPMLLRCW